MNILITGGHSGMGLELSKKLLAEGHQIALIVRSEQRKKDAIKALSNPQNLQIFLADLSKRAETKAVAAEIQSKWEHLDGIFNNAGVLLDKAYYAENGNEMHFEVNTIAPFILLKSLQPLLEKSPNPFVVNTATGGLNNNKSLDIKDLKRPSKFVKLLGSYMKSKFAMVLLMNYFNQEFSHIRMVSLNPGAIKTKMTAGNGMPFWLKPFRNLFFSTPEKGALNIYNAAFGEKFQDKNGIYINEGRIKAMNYTLSQEEYQELIG